MSDDTLHTQELESKGTGLLARAQAIAIVTAEDYTAAGEYRKMAKAHQKLVETTLKDSKDKAKAAHKAICDLEAKLTAPAEEVVRVVDRKMLDWNREQDRIRQEEQRKAEEAARKQAEADREKEAKRLEREAAKIEKTLGPEVQVQDLREKAAEIREAPVAPAPVVVQSRIPENVGATVRKVWKAEVTDKAAFIKAIAEAHPATNLDLVVVDQKGIDRLASALKESLRVPGLRSFQHESMAGTRGA